MCQTPIKTRFLFFNFMLSLIIYILLSFLCQWFVWDSTLSLQYTGNIVVLDIVLYAFYSAVMYKPFIVFFFLKFRLTLWHCRTFTTLLWQYSISLWSCQYSTFDFYSAGKCFYCEVARKEITNRSQGSDEVNSQGHHFLRSPWQFQLEQSAILYSIVVSCTESLVPRLMVRWKSYRVQIWSEKMTVICVECYDNKCNQYFGTHSVGTSHINNVI